MGLILSRFRRKASTMEVLQKIEDDMAAIEEYKEGVQRRQQRLVAVIVAYSVVLYVATGLLLYYQYFPDDAATRLMCAGALLLFPAVVYSVKRLLTWYYGRKITQNEGRLTSLKRKKEEILEEVQDKETYKVAKEILEKFAPEQLRRSPLRVDSAALSQRAPSAVGLRQRQTGVPSPVARTLLASTPASALGRPWPAQGSGRLQGSMAQPPPAIAGRAPPGIGPRSGPPLPRPVLPRERGYMDRMMEYLVGDGPANRYALICHQCQSHNGMALKEEFEYLAFRCCYCFAWNPARKQRPSAPRLPAAPVSGESMVESDTTETSESETDADGPSRPLSGSEPAGSEPIGPGRGGTEPALPGSDGVRPAGGRPPPGGAPAEPGGETTPPSPAAAEPAEPCPEAARPDASVAGRQQEPGGAGSVRTDDAPAEPDAAQRGEPTAETAAEPEAEPENGKGSLPSSHRAAEQGQALDPGSDPSSVSGPSPSEPPPPPPPPPPPQPIVRDDDVPFADDSGAET